MLLSSSLKLQINVLYSVHNNYFHSVFYELFDSSCVCLWYSHLENGWKPNDNLSYSFISGKIFIILLIELDLFIIVLKNKMYFKKLFYTSKFDKKVSVNRTLLCFIDYFVCSMGDLDYDCYFYVLNIHMKKYFHKIFTVCIILKTL